MSAPKKPSKKGDAPAKGGAAKPAPKAAGKDGGKPAAKVEAAPKAAPVVEAAPAPAPVAAAPAAAPAIAVGEPNPSAPGAHKAFRRKLVGRVTSAKMAKTVVVEVVRSTLDPMYKKYVRSRERYKAHDETNQYKAGDRVEIQEHRPISREKRWIVTRLIARPVEE
ncbi:MAG: 30S ribosomal protein S17 [Polyangiaceae bacterium]